MKRVKNIATVAHHWENRIGESAKASNLFFQGDNIYSYGYHFMIARHVFNEAGERAVLFTERTYSRSTTKQVNIVRRALNHIETMYVPDPEEDKITLFDTWSVQIRNLGHHLLKARKARKYRLEINKIGRAAKRYADFFGYELPENLLQAGQIQNYAEYEIALRKENQLQAKKTEKLRRQYLIRQKKELKDWRGCKNDYVRTTDGFDYLRFNNETKRLETTQRVEIPIEVGRQFYAVVLSVIEKGGCKDCPQKLMDGYKVLEINAKFIRVGCHKISFKEIKLFAHKMKW